MQVHDYSQIEIKHLNILAKRLGIPLGQIQPGPPADLGPPPLNTTPAAVAIQGNDEATPIVKCSVVYNSGNDHVKLANAGAMLTKDVIGLVLDSQINSGAMGQIATDGVLVATTAQWDAVFGTQGGLVFRTRYFLSPNVYGAGTSTPPSQTGLYVVALGIALSTTELLLDGEYKPILL
jgi:hypothetical protein